MTAEQWVRQHLAPHVAGDVLILERTPGTQQPSQWVEIAVFLGYFGDAMAGALASGASVYDALVDADYQVDVDGNPIVNRGYRSFFDRLKADGILI